MNRTRHKNKFRWILAGLLIGWLAGCANRPQPGKQVWMNKGLENSVVHGYWLYLPKSHAATSTRKWPVVVFLAGGLGASTDNYQDARLVGPGGLAVDPASLDDPVLSQLLQDSLIIINPHLRVGPRDKREWSQFPVSMATIIDQAIAEYQGDPQRVYLTGLSKGGHGTWELAKQLPQRLAAIVPIAGRITCDSNCHQLRRIPTWIIHYQKDPQVSYDFYAGRSVRFLEDSLDVPFLRLPTLDVPWERIRTESHLLTGLPLEGHGGWDAAYRSSMVYRWMLSQRKRPN